MNALSPGVGPTQGATALASPSSGREGGKADGGGFEQLLNAPPAHSAGKRAQAQERPTRTRDPAMAEESGGQKAPDKLAEGTSRPARTDEAGDDHDEAPWPPPGLSMIAPADVSPTPLPVADPAAALSAMQMPAAVPPQLETPDMPSATAAASPAPFQATAPMPAPTVDVAKPLPMTAGAMPSVADETGAPLPAATEALTSRAGNTGLANTDANTALPSFGHLLQGLAAPEPRPLQLTPFAGELAAPADLQAPDFDEAIGARVGWLAEQKIGHAHIRVTPHGLGAVEVKLQLEGDKVHATFTSAHAEVRHALESTLPRLREMLGEQGLQLAHADVGQQQSGPRTGDGAGGERSTAAGLDGDAGATADDAMLPNPQMIRLRGLLDAYA